MAFGDCQFFDYEIIRLIVHILSLDCSTLPLIRTLGGIKYHLSNLLYDSTWDWTPVSRTIGKHSIHLANELVYIYINIHVCVCVRVCACVCVPVSASVSLYVDMRNCKMSYWKLLIDQSKTLWTKYSFWYSPFETEFNFAYVNAKQHKKKKK